MSENFVKWIAENGESFGIVAWVLLICFGLLFAFYKEWLVLGGPWKKLVQKCEDTEKLMATVSDKFHEQQVINERSATTIEFLRQRIQDLELEIARREGSSWTSTETRRKRNP